MPLFSKFVILEVNLKKWLSNVWESQIREPGGIYYEVTTALKAILKYMFLGLASRLPIADVHTEAIIQ